MPKPSLFIGSSTEGIDFARAVRTLLDEDAEITLWNEGLFALGATFIESLVDALPRFDFAVLVLTPDEPLLSRGDQVFSPRDNVIFELGLFMGRLGRERTFVVRPRSNGVKIPSDLAGVTLATYEWPRTDNNCTAALGPACDKIREVIRSRGFSPTKVLAHVQAVEEEQFRQRKDIEILKFLVQHFVTEYELIHLNKLAGDKPFTFTRSNAFEAELRRLLAMGLIARRPGKGIRSLFKAGDDDDVRNHLTITDQGRKYLEFRTGSEGREDKSAGIA